jgi:hypothetical protein
MSRGPRPEHAISEAVGLARLRGMVQESGCGPEHQYDLAIVSTIPVAFVCVKYAVRILAPDPEIAEDFRDVISRFRSVIRDTSISCELWLRSRHGTWRFFRIAADRLIEIGRDGLPLAGKQGPGSGSVAA